MMSYDQVEHSIELEPACCELKAKVLPLDHGSLLPYNQCGFLMDIRRLLAVEWRQ